LKRSQSSTVRSEAGKEFQTRGPATVNDLPTCIVLGTAHEKETAKRRFANVIADQIAILDLVYLCGIISAEQNISESS